MEASAESLNIFNGLDQEAREHAAEQLILQTVKHHEINAGIQSQNIAKETRIDKDLVDKVLRELVRRREVMISRSGMNTFFLPFKMPAPRIAGRQPKKVPTEAVEVDVVPENDSEEEDEPENEVPPAVITKAEKKKPSNGKPTVHNGQCPICKSTQTSHQTRKHLVQQMIMHLVRMHKFSKVDARKKLIEIGVIEDKALPNHGKPKILVDEKPVAKVSNSVQEPVLPFRDAVTMGEPMAPSMPADRHDNTGAFEEDPSAEISGQDLDQIIPRGMSRELPIPASFYTKRDILEINKQICREAGIPLRFVYSSTETDKTPVNERLSMDLEG
jgi:hypothetical protein